MKTVLTPQACFVLALLGALIAARGVPNPGAAGLIVIVWVVVWIVIAVVLYGKKDEPDSGGAPPTDEGAAATDEAAPGASVVPPTRARRPVLGYGRGRETAAKPRSVAWWVWLGPVSLVCLWARLLGVFPFPYAGQRWQRHSEAMLMWAMITWFFPFVGLVIEMARLTVVGGNEDRAAESFGESFGAVGCVWVLFSVPLAVTTVGLMIAVAALHGK